MGTFFGYLYRLVDVVIGCLRISGISDEAVNTFVEMMDCYIFDQVDDEFKSLRTLQRSHTVQLQDQHFKTTLFFLTRRHPLVQQLNGVIVDL